MRLFSTTLFLFVAPAAAYMPKPGVVQSLEDNAMALCSTFEIEGIFRRGSDAEIVRTCVTAFQISEREVITAGPMEFSAVESVRALFESKLATFDLHGFVKGLEPLPGGEYRIRFWLSLVDVEGNAYNSEHEVYKATWPKLEFSFAAVASFADSITRTSEDEPPPYHFALQARDEALGLASFRFFEEVPRETYPTLDTSEVEMGDTVWSISATLSNWGKGRHLNVVSQRRQIVPAHLYKVIGEEEGVLPRLYALLAPTRYLTGTGNVSVGAKGALVGLSPASSNILMNFYGFRDTCSEEVPCYRDMIFADRLLPLIDAPD